MNLLLNLEPIAAKQPITYQSKLLLVGSCFSDNIGQKLSERKFAVLHNPTGIVFDPLSVARHLSDYTSKHQYQASDLFLQNELWNSWFHHSDFSTTEQGQTVTKINEAITTAHAQLKSASHLFITLGTAFSYQLIEQNISVANCHKAPKDWFEKRLLSIDEMVSVLQESISLLTQLNPTLSIVFTISPVKHIRDGIVENNRSKARLIEVVHQLCASEDNCSYFPAYEMVTDVLRDYRFYAQDMVHPNEQAIQFVFEQFCETFFNAETKQLMQEVTQIVSAKNHKALHPITQAHQHFLETFLQKTKKIQEKLPLLNWEAELSYFRGE